MSIVNLENIYKICFLLNFIFKAILTDYLQKIEKTTLSESQILESALYKNYNEKNLKYKQDLERAAKKLKSYEAKRDEIASSGKVSPSNYIKDLSFQKLTDGANDFRNKMSKLIYREESSGAGGQKDEQPKVDLNNDESNFNFFYFDLSKVHTKDLKLLSKLR